MTAWLRLWHDMPNDPKFRTIARISGQRIGDVIAVFLHVLVDASANANERGRAPCQRHGKSDPHAPQPGVAAMSIEDFGVTLVFVAICAAVIGVLAYFGPTQEEMAAREYQQNYPCINGIRYIRSGASNAQNLTPMIDPATMQPQLCGAERAQ